MVVSLFVRLALEPISNFSDGPNHPATPVSSLRKQGPNSQPAPFAAWVRAFAGMTLRWTQLRLPHPVDLQELLGRRRRIAGNFALAEDDRLAEQQPDLDVAHHQPEEAPVGFLGAVETQQPRLPPCFQHRLQALRSEEHTSELQSRENLVCRLLLEK